jgi:hypothetical protein
MEMDGFLLVSALYSWENIPRYPLDRKLDVSKNQSGINGKE